MPVDGEKYSDAMGCGNTKKSQIRKHENNKNACNMFHTQILVLSVH
jgi:hypothetical protein